MKRLGLVAGVAAVLVGATACGGSGNGSGSPTTGGSTTSSGQTSTTTTKSTASLAQTDPCSLLPSADQTTVGATSVSENQIGGAPDCDVHTANGVVGVTITVGKGLSEIPVTGPESNLPIGSHQAVKMTDTSDQSTCLVSLAVTTSSRVDVTSEVFSGDPCPLAMQVATLVEKHLPSS